MSVPILWKSSGSCTSTFSLWNMWYSACSQIGGIWLNCRATEYASCRRKSERGRREPLEIKHSHKAVHLGTVSVFFEFLLHIELGFDRQIYLFIFRLCPCIRHWIFFLFLQCFTNTFFTCAFLVTMTSYQTQPGIFLSWDLNSVFSLPGKH